jgi:signal transduction histidine kinase
MTFRARLLLAFAALVMTPLALVGLGIRYDIGTRLTQLFREHAVALASLIEAELGRESEEIAARLAGVAADLQADNRFRNAVLQRTGVDRQYVLDLAGSAMRSSGLAMLQIQDNSGRIISSGHFRNEYDRLEPELPVALSDSQIGMALISARTAAAPFLALVRCDSFQVGGRWFTLVGGNSVEREFLRRLAGEQELAVSLVYPGGVVSSQPDLEQSLVEESTGSEVLEVEQEDERRRGEGVEVRTAAAERALSDQVVTEIAIPYIVPRSGGQILTAQILVTHPLSELHQLRRSVDLLFAAAIGVTAVAALVVAIWLSSRLSKPLAELASKTSQIDLDRLDVGFETDRKDEIGALSRLLGSMTDRLRNSTVRMKEIERRATVGEIARQVNHDIKNGLIPIRNVLRHLQQVTHEDPDRLTAVYLERQATLDSSITYLENLAANYARLYPKVERQPCEANEIVRQLGRGLGAGLKVHLDLDERVPAVRGDPVALRRIIENLLANAVEAVQSDQGAVTISSRSVVGGAGPAVQIVVADTGPGMSEQQLERAFQDFYTTKAGGTGLGLSVVRRLVLDLNGTLRVESEPGVGTRFIVELPAVSGGTLEGQ